MDDNDNCNDIRIAVEKEKTVAPPNRAVRDQLIKDAVERGCVDCIPDDWSINVRES